MSFDVRCPECSAKLRLDEEPQPGTIIECTRCASQFEPPLTEAEALRPKRKPKPGRTPKPKKKKKDNTPKRLQSRKKKTNPLVLLLAIGFGFVCIALIGFLLVWFVSRAGQLDKVLTFVPNECTHIRGVNNGSLRAYPGYKPEVDKFLTGNVTTGIKELANLTGLEEESMVDYFVHARSFESGNPMEVYVFYTHKKYDTVAAGDAAANSATPILNGTAYRMRGTAINGQLVAFPNERVIVVVAPIGQGSGEETMRQSLAGQDDITQSLAGNRNATVDVAVRGSIWLVVRATGPTEAWVQSSLATGESDMQSTTNKMKGAATVGLWTTPGSSGVRVGAALECPDEEVASELVDDFKEGPLGKGDESEPPNSIKKLPIFSRDKKLKSEFLQNLVFKSRAECAYLYSKLTDENAKSGMGIFNDPNMGLPRSGGGFR